jgi:hypothetical protein
MATRKRKQMSPENELVHAEYTQDSESNHYNCKHCSYKSPSNHTGNMESHLMRKHKDLYQEIIGKRKDLRANKSEEVPSQLTRCSMNLSIEEFRKSIVEIVTVNGRPLKYLEDSGFQKIIRPTIEALSTIERITVSRTSVCPWIHEEAEKLRTEIKLKIKEKMISVKIDLATRLGRSIFGLNAQYVDDCKLKILTLAMKEFDEAHTAEKLLTEFEKIMKSYDISLGQIYRVTSDNGSNMIKMGQLLKDKENLTDVESETDDDDVDSMCDSDLSSESDSDEETDKDDLETSSDSMMNDDLDDENDELVDLGSMFQNKFKETTSLVDILRCFEHSLQLGPADLIKKHSIIKRLVSIGKKASKKLRNQVFTRLLKSKNLKKPILSNKTRWGSSYLMLKRLISLRSFCDEHIKLAKELKISVIDWRKLEKLQEVLEPVYESTIYYQKAQLTLSEAYAQWIRMELKIKDMCNEFSAVLLEALKKHSHKMMDNPCVLAGVFLDPRYQKLLETDQKIEAKKHISEVFNYLLRTGHREVESNPAQLSHATIDLSNSPDPLLRLLASRDCPAESQTASISSSLTLDEILSRFEKVPRVLDESFNLIKYWSEVTGEFADLKQTAFTIYSAASTQVSVERSFSALKFILNDQRGNLDRDRLEEILLIYLNKKFQQ